MNKIFLFMSMFFLANNLICLDRSCLLPFHLPLMMVRLSNEEFFDESQDLLEIAEVGDDDELPSVDEQDDFDDQEENLALKNHKKAFDDLLTILWLNEKEPLNETIENNAKESIIALIQASDRVTDPQWRETEKEILKERLSWFEKGELVKRVLELFMENGLPLTDAL